MGITTNIERYGNFTSSKIGVLTGRNKKKDGFSVAALSYIEERNMERLLNRSIKDEVNAKPLIWGKFLEPIVFKELGLSYSLKSDTTYIHPLYNCWSGSPDGFKHEDPLTVFDIKCPLTLKSFCQLVQPLYQGLNDMEAMDMIREKHPEGDTYFWQLVSNACLSAAALGREAEYAELIVKMPYQSEIAKIKELADGVPNAYFITMAMPDELPFIHDIGYYRSLNKIRFKIRQEDKDFLTESVEMASKLLIPKDAYRLPE